MRNIRVARSLAVAAAVFLAGCSTVLPPEATVAIAPFSADTPRPEEAELWGSTHHAVFNALNDAPSERLSGLVDPLEIDAEIERRGWTPPLDDASTMELGAVVNARVVVSGHVSRVDGRVTLRLSIRDNGATRWSVVADDADMLSAADRAAARIRSTLVDAGMQSSTPRFDGVDPHVRAAWATLIRDPRTRKAYSALEAAGVAAGDHAVTEYAHALSRSVEACTSSASVLAERGPTVFGPLAHALCQWRWKHYEVALGLGLEAFGRTDLRRLAGAFVSRTERMPRGIQRGWPGVRLRV